jgi:hypothetical protein
MGGRIGRTWFALLVTAALLLTILAGPGAVLAEGDACALTCEHCAELPPYHESAVLIQVGWTDRQDVRLNFWAAPPGSDPYAGAYWSGGCIDGPLLRHCEPVEPLILTQADAGGRNLWYYPGALELTAEAVPCSFADDIPENPGEEGPRHLDVCARISEVNVTASIEHYRAGGSQAHVVEPPVEPLGTTVPLYPCDAYPDPTPYRRILGTFDWDPVKGVKNVQGPGEGPTQEGPAHSDDVEGELDSSALDVPVESGEASASSQPGRADAPGAGPETIDADVRLEAILRALTKFGASAEEDFRWSERSVMGGLLLLITILNARDAAEARGEDLGRYDAGAYALLLFLRVLDGDDEDDRIQLGQDPPDTAPPDAPPLTTVPPPTKDPPKLKGKQRDRFDKQNRQWV